MTTQIPQAAAVNGAAQPTPKDAIAYHLKKRSTEIAKMLPKHLNAERLLKVAQIAATSTPGLVKCDVASLVGAIGQCAQMGLEPNTVLGHAYLVPFNTKRKDGNGNERWVNSVQVIIGYKGLIDLARRSGQIVSIAAHEVCENDHFDLVYGLDEKLEHRPALGERGEVIGFYAVAKLKDGGYCFEFMSRKQVEQIREGSQAAYKDEWVGGRKTGNRIPMSGPWWDHFIEMGRKTVIRRLAKYLPLSVEFQTAAALDGLAEAGKDQHLDAGTIIDGEFAMVPEDMQQDAAEPTPDPGPNEDGVIDVPASSPAPAPPQAGSQSQISYTPTQVLDLLLRARTLEKLDEAADLIMHVDSREERQTLSAKYDALREEIEHS
ncbi:hypothetical protein DJFAAGMI_01307 [Comamonas sp. PE63]|uniref:Recombinase RecT n=1 Tax=Comamonas brasiliensis TaxID=1812482 RepID=A0ABS5LPZ3_9BURK|nr:recombinase RecT [Comamonas sp. PE63]MBS3018575.1 hypothetical protein [Comamonas sp. PE63]